MWGECQRYGEVVGEGVRLVDCPIRKSLISVCVQGTSDSSFLTIALVPGDSPSTQPSIDRLSLFRNVNSSIPSRDTGIQLLREMSCRPEPGLASR